MSVYYGYKNHLWKQINHFAYTGSPQQFSLQPGTYLLECKGAVGGRSKQQNTMNPYGGVAYGVLSLEENQTMYAYVGGAGGNTPDEQPTAGIGGWNGGGNGGTGSSGYYGGAGGGGGTDIRLFRPEDIPNPPLYYPEIPAEYEQIEYIDTTNITQYINTGKVATKYSIIDFKASIVDTEKTDMAVCGGRVSSSATGNRWDCWFSNYGRNHAWIESVYGNRKYLAADELPTGIASGVAATYKLTPGEVYINGELKKEYSSSSGNPYSGNVYVMGINQNGTFSYPWHGKMHFFRMSSAGPATPWTFLNSVQCSVSGRVYTTIDAPCLVMIAHGGGWRGPFVISKTPGTLYSPYGSSVQFEYNGETWYNSDTGGWFSGEDGGDDLGNVPRAPISIDVSSTATKIQFAKDMLDYVYALTDNPLGMKSEFTTDIELIPVKRVADDVIGMYDTVSGNFFTGAISGTAFDGGAVGTYAIPRLNDVDPDTYKNNTSLMSRLIVAGGGGGSAGFDYESNRSPNYANFGGGVNGGPAFATNASSINGVYPTQTSGYKFGQGQSAANRTSSSYNDNGASGAGGGWYGGYALQTTNTSGMAAPGSGGSGFVFDTNATLPSNYAVPNNFMLTNTFMCGNKSIGAEINIFESASEEELVSGDIIKFIGTGSPSSINLRPGTYLLKCKGCDGSVRYNIGDSVRGGYSEGILSIGGEITLKAFVGGTGIGDNLISPDYVRSTFPDIGYNGGGMPVSLGGGFTGHSGGAGSGATDFRVSSGEVDASPYLSRLIVAGGAGGCGAYVGGVGGGLTGGEPSGSTGVTPGPGTQTESPESQTYPQINGGFGYGGNAGSTGDGLTTGVSGGSGGGGWYGGSGTYPANKNDVQKGGAGGSGFVYTSESVTPPGYLVPSTFALDNAITTQGGNDLPVGLSEAIIEVIDILSVHILCKDDEGIKGYNNSTHRWEYIGDELDISMFTTHGVLTFATDAGLCNEYDILVYDEDDAITSAKMDVVPAAQNIRYETITQMTVDRLVFDTDYDRNIFDIDISVERQPRGALTKVIINAVINKRVESSKKPKIYSGIMMSK